MNKTVLAAALALCLGTALADQPQPLEFVKAISLAGVNGRLNHMAVDPEKDRLYLAAVANDSLEVIDLKLGKRARTIPGPKGPQSVDVLPESHEVVLSSGEDGVCRLYDSTLNLVRFINDVGGADCVRYDSGSKRIYLGCATGLAVVDPNGPTRLADIALESQPESFQVEKNGPNIYANLPDSQEVVVINKDTAQVTARWSLLEAHDNFPMALDEKNHRLFVGCRRPAKVLVYDTTLGSYIGKVDCVADADDLHYDSEQRRIYVTGGQGFVTVIDESDPYLYKVRATISTSPGARTSCFEPSSGMLYVAVPERKKQPAELRVYKTRP